MDSDTMRIDLEKNMRIWHGVETTDPEYTKKVSQRGGFTSIDAMYQVKRMTQVFGPVGRGWGYTCCHSIERISDSHVAAICDVTVWWTTNPDAKTGERPDDWNCFGPIRGLHWIMDKADGRADDDAPKKAMTDALTKAISHLGFSADVYMGLFDDDKYVEAAKKKFDSEPPPEINILWSKIDAMKKPDHGVEDLNKLYKDNEPAIVALSAALKNTTVAKFASKKKELT